MVISREQCHVCGNVSDFLIDEKATLFRDAVCSTCGASIRASDVAGVILKEYGAKYASLEEAGDNLPITTILNAATSGYIHEYLKFYPEYISGEYLNGVKSGQYKEGILCIDLQNIPLRDNSVDLVVSEDVFEHVEDYEEAFREVYRVLKPGGRHIFTVPIHENRATKSRIGNDKEVFHGDPIRSKGCFVCTDFGNDIQELLRKHGFNSTVIMGHKFYEPEEITDADTTYDEYLSKKDCMERYFKYNSIVILSEKQAGFPDSGRWNYCLDYGREKEKAFVKLHRYAAIRDLVKDKSVLVVECGSGSCCYVLADCARVVHGVSSVNDNIVYAKQRYSEYENMRFSRAAIPDLNNMKDCSVDVVVAFDTVEYLTKEEQQLLFKEMGRILRPNGILAISTIDKMESVDRLNLDAELLKGAFYADDFFEFVAKEYKYVNFYKQYLEVASFIEGFKETGSSLSLFEQREVYNPRQKYILAIASNGCLPESGLSSVCMNESQEYQFMQNNMHNRKMQVEQKNITIQLQGEELERRAEELEHRMDKINELNHMLQEAQNTIKLQKEELDRRAEELEHRMDKINELERKLL